MRFQPKRRGGFTLPEVLVTVSIIAILSAAVVPSVIRQIDKGDTGRMASDISSIRTGVEQFVTDVRKYPRNVSEISRKISTSDSDLVNGTAFTALQVSRWKGPYVTKDSTGILRTAYGWTFNPRFYLDTFSRTPFTQGLALETAATLPESQVLSLDSLLDDGSLTSGFMRYEDSTTVGTGKLKIILVPIQ